MDAIRNKYASYTNKYYLIQINLIQLIQNIIHLNPYINKSTDFLNHFKLDRSLCSHMLRKLFTLFGCEKSQMRSSAGETISLG